MATWVRRNSLIALTLLVATLRFPAFLFDVMDIDETDFLVAARMMAKGAVPYVDVVEKKPVLAYLFYWPVNWFGFRMWPMQILAILWIAGTCWIIGKAAERWTGKPAAGLAAAGLAALAQSCQVLSVNLEMMFNLPAALALLYYIKRETGGGLKHDFAVGVCLGIATLFKHQVGVLAIAIAIALVWQWLRAGRGPQLARHLLMMLGFAIPWAITLGVYARLGHLREFWEWNIERNLFYASGGDSRGQVLLHFAMGIVLCVIGSAPVAWWAAIQESRKRMDPIRVALVLSLWLSWISVSLGLRFYNHYFLQFIPPLALLAAPRAGEWLEKWGELPSRTRRRIGAWLILPIVWYSLYHYGNGIAGRYPGQEKRSREIGAWMRRNSKPDERLFVWGHFTPIYYFSERLPGTRYYNTSVHMGDFDPNHLPADFDPARDRSDRDVRYTLDDLERNRPALVVDTAPADIHNWHVVPLERFPELDGWVRAHYRVAGTPGGARVWRRVD